LNRIAKRAGVLLLLVGILFAGLIFFVAEYVTKAGEWVVFPGSPHVYYGGNLGYGTVVDRNNVILLDMNQTREYSQSEALRKATVHWLGDRSGSVDGSALASHSHQMVGFDLLNGIYSYGDTGSVAKLSLCAQAQMAALEALGDRRGTVAVYNYKTGEILCAVTSPTYDPDQVPKITEENEAMYEGVYVNRFFRSSYTPGSVFKALTASAALAEIEGIESMTFYCGGEVIIDGERIVCAGYHGEQDLATAFKNSCNVAFGELTVLLGKETMSEYADMIGINSSLLFDGIHTISGSFDVSEAGEGSLAWAGIGQYTDLINPCQYMTFMGMLANGGKAAQPYLMERIVTDGTVSYEADTVMLDSGLKPEVTRTMVQMMRNNVVQGYGTAMFPDVEVCAKSGTAEMAEGKQSTALFAGFVTDDRYPLAFIVVVEEGGTGASAAAPIAGSVLSSCVAFIDSQNSSK